MLALELIHFSKGASAHTGSCEFIWYKIVQKIVTDGTRYFHFLHKMNNHDESDTVKL